jgi:hypothetical protein
MVHFQKNMKQSEKNIQHFRNQVKQNKNEAHHFYKKQDKLK